MLRWDRVHWPQRKLVFKARVKEKQRFEMQRHISRITGKKVSTLRRIPNVIIALRFVINISLALVWFGFGGFFFVVNQSQLYCIAAGMPVRLGPDPELAAIMMGRWKSQAHSQAALLGGASLWNGEIMETRCAVDAWDSPQSVWELLSVRGRAHYHHWKWPGPHLLHTTSHIYILYLLNNT